MFVPPTGFSGTVPIFNGEQNYTRRGDFALNADGYLVNGSGFYLEGIPIDSTTGDPVGNVATPLNFQSNFLPASATTEVDYAVNLPATPQTTATSSLIPNSNLLNAANFTQNPTLVATSNSNAVVTATAALTTINLSGQGATTASITEGAFSTLNVSGGGDWEWTVCELRDCPNVYLDTSGSGMDEGTIEACVRELGVERILFATDMSMEAGIGKILSAQIDSADREMIWWRNMHNILERRK